jgi:predicted RND superfamily exporter protein
VSNREARARAYVAWLARHARLVLAGCAVALIGAGSLIATRLPIRADFSYLLPENAPAIRALRRLEQRMPSNDTTLILLTAPDPATRARAAEVLIGGLRAIDADHVARIEADDDEARAVIGDHRWLYVPLDDLIATRAALAARIHEAKLRANPLYVSLDDRSSVAPHDRLDELRARRHEAEHQLDHSRFISDDDMQQLVIVRMPFRATDVSRDRELLAAIAPIVQRVRAVAPGVEIELAGGAPSAVAEHDAVARGMVLSSLVTTALVALVLLVHLRRVSIVAIVGLQIVAATVLSFGLAAITVGHLNAATAFLGAIIAGNGINYGILLAARYGEECATASPHDALARAIATTLRPTLVAALGASIAYGALAATRFRGFADFAIIGGLGMLVCWIVAYTVFPALLLLFPRLHPPDGQAVFGRAMAPVARVRHGRVMMIAALVLVAASAVTLRFVLADPFEYDMQHLRSDSPAALAASDTLARINTSFGRGWIGRSYFAVDRDEDVPALVAALRDASQTPAGKATIGRVESVLDLVPPDQPAKLVVLGGIRRQLDDPALDALDDNLRAELHDLRPPDALRAVALADFPRETIEPFRERDGSVGRIVAVRPATSFDDSDGRAMQTFASVARSIVVPRATLTTSGSSLVLADILAINRADGPLVTGIAALGLIVMVLVVVGRNRKAAAVLAATALGSIAMVAACALLGLRINFLDFVALPIALGLGIDYAINIGDRVVEDGAQRALRTTGGSVLVCSLTTIIGYASILFSANRAIRDFGTASLVGEITCVASALLVVPALLSWKSREHE